MENLRAQYYTAQQLSELGEDRIPSLYSVTSHLVYSSPATLAYNSPGAEGFGVKRAGLAIPDSVMLIVSPPCCGRNTSQISEMPGYRNRFFYLEMDETDLVTGRHLRMIPDAVASILASLEKKPSLVMICATCVDALLGTDWDRVARAAEEKTGVKVRPCYMYALTREGRKPPMVHVRQSLYSLLEKTKRRRGAVNLMGFFAPLIDDTELYDYLHSAGVGAIRELSRCESYEQFLEMSEAHFNLVLNPECRAAADDLSERLGMPYMELKRFYDPERIHRQYSAFFKVLGLQGENNENVKEGNASETVDSEDAAGTQRNPREDRGRRLLEREQRDYEETIQVVREFHRKHPDLKIAIGETLNADPFELSLALASGGARVMEVFGTVAAESMPYITRLAQISPQTRFYCNQDPSMMFFRGDENEICLALGKDAAHYHPETAQVNWNEDRQPFGYAGVRKLYEAMEAALGNPADSTETELLSGKEADSGGQMIPQPASGQVHGFRRHLTPFAPDQSGAVSVLYALGGMTVIVDAGGCAGNICGFDEPRWLMPQGAGAVFSAGLRDMDAILGRDDLLVEKLTEAAQTIRPEFIALVGTPVPAVIATDYRALKRMAEKKTSLKVLPVPTNGMELYDRGIETAFLELMKTYAGEMPQDISAAVNGTCDTSERESGTERKQTPPAIGVIGFTPMDFRISEDAAALKKALTEQGYGEVLIYGLEGGLDAVRRAASVSRNLVVSPAGIAAADYLEKTFAIPYETGYPSGSADGDLLSEDGLVRQTEGSDRILIVHQQVRANALREQIRKDSKQSVTAASWFMMLPEMQEEGDVSLREEGDFISLVRDGGYDLIIADPVLKRLVPFYGGKWIDAVHFAVSGQAPAADRQSRA